MIGSGTDPLSWSCGSRRAHMIAEAGRGVNGIVEISIATVWAEKVPEWRATDASSRTSGCLCDLRKYLIRR